MEKKKLFILGLVVLVTVALCQSPALAKELLIFDRPLNILLYVTQGTAVSLSDKDRYDTEKGLQSALMNLFIEMDYKISDKMKFYTSERFSVDWAYQLKHNDDSWHDKLFNQSKSHLNVDNKYWQILNEAHLTWTPKNFFLRVGKQIVSWGEMDAIRVMDQINPLDSRRGFADVEFENTIIPIWLIRTEFYPRITTSWLQDLALEFVFNPNADFIPNQDIKFGNDDGGIWAPNIRIPDPMFGEVRFGSEAFSTVKKPGHFNHKGYEYGFRVKGVIKDAIITLNAFYGLDNSPILKFSDPFNPFPVITIASDGKLLLHPGLEGKFPRFRFVGITFTRDIPFLKASFLGGVAPVIRLETFYAYNNTFTDAFATGAPSLNIFRTFNEFRAAFGCDWKVKIPLLNQRGYFTISPQVFYRRVDLPNGAQDWFDTALTRVGKNNWLYSLYISTSYLNARLTPSLFWLRDQEFGSDFFRLQITYDWTQKWRFTIGALLFTAKELPLFKSNNSFDLFKHKDQIFFKITYKWS